MSPCVVEGKLRGDATRAILVDSKQEGLEDHGRLFAGSKGEVMNRKIGALWTLIGLLSTLSFAQSWRGAEAVALQVNDSKGRPVGGARVVFWISIPKSDINRQDAKHAKK